MPESLLEKCRRAAHSVRRRTIGEKHVEAYYRFRGSLKNTGSIWLWPDPPEGYSIHRVCCHLGLKVTRNISPDVLIGINWDDDTFPKPPPPAPFRILNDKCLDISKARVAAVFYDVFGYATAIDPLTYSGKAVSKSNINAAHDGRVIDCPIEAAEPGRVYERLFNNVVSDYLVEDIRVPIVGSQLPFAYIKRRFIRERFTNDNRSVKRVPLDFAVSKQEQGLILQFAAAMNLEWGEIDAVRDRKDGRLYIVDANKTPGGPPARMPFFPKIAAITLLAKAFQSEFLGERCHWQIGDGSQQQRTENS